MKHFALISLVICSLFFLHSCYPLGKWAPIVVDNDTVYFGNDGGTKVVSITRNYNSWWINGIKDITSNEYFYPTNDVHGVVEGNGIKAIVDGKTLTITVSPISAPEEFHEWIVDMEFGDAFKSIKVWQNKPKVE